MLEEAGLTPRDLLDQANLPRSTYNVNAIEDAFDALAAALI